MLRAWILCFLPNIMTANFRDTYMEQARPIYTGKHIYGYPSYYPEPNYMSQTYLPKKPGPPYKLNPFNELLKPIKPKKPFPLFMDAAYASNKEAKNKQETADSSEETKNKQDFLGNNAKLGELSPFFTDIAYVKKKKETETKYKEDFLEDSPKVPENEDLPSNEVSNPPYKDVLVPDVKKPALDESEHEEALPKNEVSTPFYEDESAINGEDVRPFNNNIPKQYDTKLPNATNKIPLKKLINEEGIVPIKNKIPKFSTKLPDASVKINEQHEEDIVPVINNTPKSYEIPDDVTESEEYELLSIENPKQGYGEYASIPPSIVEPKPKANEYTFPPNKKITLPTVQPLYEDLPNKQQMDEYRLPVLTATPPRFPITTERPAEDDFFDDNPIEYYKSKLPGYPEIPVKEWDNQRKDRLIKTKLVSLILSTKKSLDKEIDNIRPIHNTFKSGTMYKIGYLISLINKMNRRLSRLYAAVLNNAHNWDVLKMLDMYEKLLSRLIEKRGLSIKESLDLLDEMKSDGELVADMVKLLRAFLKVKRQSSMKLKGKGIGERLRPNMGISWSYYDDSLS